MKNLEIAALFRQIARILEIKGGNVFRIRAYERAAQNIQGLACDIEDIARKGKLTDIPGIGRDLSEMIKEYLDTGRLNFYEELKKTLPSGVLDLLNIPSVGPKTARLLYERLKIKNIPGLEKAIKKNKLKGIFGIKEKTVENMLRGIELVKRGRERMTLAQATVVSDEFLGQLKKLPEVKRVSIAGSLRRQKETVRDIDILVISSNPRKVMHSFARLPMVKEAVAEGRTKASIRTQGDVQVDCRVLDEKSFGAALIYFTGSKNFNIKLRQLAIKKGIKVNEYGIFRRDKFVAGRTEEEVFKALGMAYIEPELREDTGEIELARNFKLPRLLELKDIKGDLHAHSTWSDGKSTIGGMAEAAKKAGYSYIAITDHSRSLRVAGGLSVAELRKKKAEIERINARLKGFRVLYGAEVDIDSGGKLDYKDEVLKEFDIVVAAIHSGFKQSCQQLTKRIIRACQSKYAHIIAHPTGRIWGSRDAYDIDFEEIFKACRDTNTHLEINAFANRLDLNGQNARRAKDAGVRLAIGTDSHEAGQLGAMRFGLAMARRGWLTRDDVINTLPVGQLLKTLKKQR